MEWIGMIVLVVHHLAPETGWVQVLNGFLKWMALMVGGLQASGLLISLSEHTSITADQRALLVAWSVANIGAFVVLRSAEKARLEERRGETK